MGEDTLRDSVLMKEFDCNKWDNHPREMWVWNYDENDKVKRLVVHIEKGIAHPILAVDKEEGYYPEWWKYCAEIEQTRCMTVKEIDEKVESLKKEIYELHHLKLNLTKELTLEGLQENHYYKMHLNSCDIIWFKFDPKDIYIRSDNVIFSHCLKMHLAMAHMDVGYCNQFYIPLERLGGRSLLHYFEPEEITEEEFMEELEDAKKHIDEFLGGKNAKEKENNG